MLHVCSAACAVTLWLLHLCLCHAVTRPAVVPNTAWMPFEVNPDIKQQAGQKQTVRGLLQCGGPDCKRFVLRRVARPSHS
jgi:hypothetical protein